MQLNSAGGGLLKLRVVTWEVEAQQSKLLGTFGMKTEALTRSKICGGACHGLVHEGAKLDLPVGEGRVQPEYAI